MRKFLTTAFLFISCITLTEGQILVHTPTIHAKGSLANKVDLCFRFAIGDLQSNVQLYKNGLLESEKPCLLAGAEYDTPWTRDAAINTWNGLGLLYPEVAKNTLLSVLNRDSSKKIFIDGQYWDKIIWCVGAWNYYLFTGDSVFLDLAYHAVVNTIGILEKDEYDDNIKLFRGASVYGDGVAAYPDIYTKSEDSTKNGLYSGIDRWPSLNPGAKAKIGYGLPMMALSTNCLYYETYVLLTEMEKALGLTPDKSWSIKALRLKEAINENFWKRKRQQYSYLVDPYGGCDAQEGIGISFALLFGLADEATAKVVFKKTLVSANGIPCLYPSFQRYFSVIDDNVGRHCGTVWPPIQAFWADAAIHRGKTDLFDKEFKALTNNAYRDKEFAELYHPISGQRYGGLQEPSLKKRQVWFCSDRQSWSASGYLRMILSGIAGLRMEKDGITFKPYLPDGLTELVLEDIPYRNSILTIKISGKGNTVKSCKIDGVAVEKAFVSAKTSGTRLIEIVVN